MILVVRKLFTVLELLRGGGAVAVKDLALASGQDKGSLCRLLQSLVELGYAEKPAAGRYRLTPRFAALGRAVSREEEVTRLCGQAAARLAALTEESGVVTTLRGPRIEILGQAQHPRRVMVQISHYRDLSFYGSASGRALLAALDERALQALVQRAGLPARGEWPQTGSTAAFARGLRQLQRSDLVTKDNPRSEVSSFALAVKDARGRVCAALGLTVPVFRMTKTRRARVERALRQGAGELESALRAKGLQQADFLGEDAS